MPQLSQNLKKRLIVYRRQKPSNIVSLSHFQVELLFIIRLEKERGALSSEHEDLATQLEELQKSKAILEKKLRAAEEQLADTSAKVL